MAGKRVFPDFNMGWHFDNKEGQKYCLDEGSSHGICCFMCLKLRGKRDERLDENEFMGVNEFVNKVRKSNDGRKLMENFAYLSLLQMAGYVFPLITLPYLASVIGVEGFGKIAFASAVMVWVQTVADWGFNYTATRDVARNRENKDKVSDIFSKVLWARCFLMICSFVLLVLLVSFIPKFKENAAVIFVTFLMIPGHIMFPDWFFQAMERMKYITILNLLSKLLFTVLVFVFVKDKDDYILQPLFLSLGFVLAGIVAMYYILVKWEVKLKFISFGLIIKTIKSSTDVFVNNIAPNLYNTFSTILLGILSGDTANGILDAGKRFYQIMYGFVSNVSRVFFPFLSRKLEKHAFFAKIYLLIGLFSTVFLFVGAPLLIKIFFGDSFRDSVLVLRLISISFLFLTMQSVYGNNYLLIKGYEKLMRNITMFSSVIGFIMAFPLIYYFSYVGAAIVYSFSSILLGALYMFYALKIKKGTI